VQNLGAFIDDIVVSTGEGSTSFETGLDGWAVTGPPSGSAANGNDWIRSDATGFPVGASITTPKSVLMGYGIEGISTPGARAAVMGGVMDYLLPDPYVLDPELPGLVGPTERLASRSSPGTSFAGG